MQYKVSIVVYNKSIEQLAGTAINPEKVKRCDNMNKNPYNYLPLYYIDRPELFEYLKNSPRTDYIVTIMLDGVAVNELLQYDGQNDSWAWANDWYEGETDVTWVGIVALEDVLTYTPDTGDIAYKASMEVGVNND